MEGGVSAVAAVEAEDELVEISLEMLGAQAVIDALGPALEVGEDAVDPGEHEMARHRADHMGIMARDRCTWIACPPIGLGGGAGCDACFEEGMQAVGGIVGMRERRMRPRPAPVISTAPTRSGARRAAIGDALASARQHQSRAIRPERLRRFAWPTPPGARQTSLIVLRFRPFPQILCHGGYYNTTSWAFMTQ